MKYNNISSIEYVIKHFPTLHDDIYDECIDGLLHPQIAAFATYAQRAIDERNSEAWMQVCGAFQELWLNADDELVNALNVSFLEHLYFQDENIKRGWAYKAMPKIMRKAWDEMQDYLKRLSELSKDNTNISVQQADAPKPLAGLGDP